MMLYAKSINILHNMTDKTRQIGQLMSKAYVKCGLGRIFAEEAEGMARKEL
jgi:hypothetical protein